VDPSINKGQVPGVTGTLTVSGDANFTITPIASFTAQPIATVDPTKFTDTLNFLIPADQATGTLELVAQATVGSNVSNPQAATMTFSPVGQLNILIVRVQTATTSAPTRAQYLKALNRLPLIYPIPTDPAVSIQYWLPGSEVVVCTQDLTTQDGMDDFLDDLEDIQEDSPDYKKLYGLVDNNAPMKRVGNSSDYDNVAFGYSFIMESIGHELGHLYDLDHAPCGNPDSPVDDDFVPANGRIGEVGVDTVRQVAILPASGDIMSYCANRALPYENEWISAYHWTKLFMTFRGL
jgi:hypothetical protein